MKKRFLMILLTAAMILVPFAAFAQTVKAEDFVQTYPGWNADRSVYYLAENTPAKGLFKAKMSDDVGALFYADDTGKVVKKAGPITVAGTKTRFLRSKDSEGHWGFREVPASDKNAYTYFIGTKNGEGAIVEEPQFYTCSAGKYYVQANGTVKMGSGFVDVDGKRYYVAKNGLVRTKKGWIKYKGKKYRTGNNGVVHTKEGAFTVGNNRYVIQSDGSVCTKKGAVKANGYLYFVKNNKGVLGRYYSYKLNNKVYHVNRKGVIKVGRHKWKNGKYYYSVKKGYLKTSSGMVTEDGDRFYVEKGGLIVVNQKFKHNKWYYIAKKNGTLYTGLFKWHGTLYYATDKGALKSKPGVVKVGNKSYYVQAGGAVYVNQRVWANGNLYIADTDGHLLSGFFDWGGARHYAGTDCSVYYNKIFTVDGKTYIADGNGNIRTGVFKFGGRYYHSGSDGVLNTKEGIVYYRGKYYYNKDGGGLKTHQFVNANGNHYYAGNNGAFFTRDFYYKAAKFTIHPDPKDGHISDEEYEKAINALG